MKYAGKDYIIYSVSILFFCAIGYFLFHVEQFKYVAALLLVLLLIPQTGKPITEGWKKVTHYIGLCVNAVLLGIVFLLVLTPMALLKRVFTGRKRTDQIELNSYYQDESKAYEFDDITKAW